MKITIGLLITIFIPTPNSMNQLKEDKDLIPATRMIVQKIQTVSSGRLLKVLLDSGGSKTMIKSLALHKGCVPKGAFQSLG